MGPRRPAGVSGAVGDGVPVCLGVRLRRRAQRRPGAQVPTAPIIMAVGAGPTSRPADRKHHAPDLPARRSSLPCRPIRCRPRRRPEREGPGKVGTLDAGGRRVVVKVRGDVPIVAAEGRPRHRRDGGTERRRPAASTGGPAGHTTGPGGWAGPTRGRRGSGTRKGYGGSRERRKGFGSREPDAGGTAPYNV